MDLNGARIMVTGATGLLGAGVVRLLIERGGVDVRVFARNRQKTEMFAHDPVEIVIGDITDGEAVLRATEGCDVVIHSVMATEDGDTRQVNVEGTRHVLDAAVEQGIKRLVHVSSVAVYHPVVNGVVNEASAKETDGSTTSYHDTKLASEILALDYCREKGLSVVVLQPVVVYGPRASHWSADVLKQLRSHRILLVDEAQSYHNVVYVDDVTRAMVLAAHRDGIEGECFIISGKEDIPSRDFYRAYEKMLGAVCVVEATAQELESVDGDLEELACRKGMPAERPVVQVGFGSGLHYSCAKASRLLGYEPEIGFAQGMVLTEAWARRSGLLE